MRVICFHGTNIEAVSAIRTKGFRPWTYFARHLEDAIAFGGPYVFDVVFDDPPEHWQFMNRETISPDLIVSRRLIRATTIYENGELRDLVLQGALAQEEGDG